ncbi:MAG: guanylate kinase [bacterium]
MNKQGKIFIISAPSGAGKTTLTLEGLNRLKNKYPISKVITYTTRKPRQNEKHGKDYHFLSETEFLNKQKKGFFLETTKYHDNYYGSPTDILDKIKQGQSFIIVVDYPGAQNYLTLIHNPILIWIEPPSLSELEKRLKKRNDSAELIKTRLKLAEKEMITEKKEHLFKYNLINDDFEKTVNKLISIIEKEISNEDS